MRHRLQGFGASVSRSQRLTMKVYIKIEMFKYLISRGELNMDGGQNKITILE